MPPISISFRRHAQKTKDGSKLTNKGKTDTITIAKDMSESTKIYSSIENRTKETSEILKIFIRSEYQTRLKNILRGHKYFSGKRIRTTKKDSLLTYFKEISEKIGISDAYIIKIWLSGKFPKKIIPKPEIIADEIIKDRFRVPNRIKETDKSIIFENITHDVVIAALFQRLSGERYHYQFKDLPKELESLRIDLNKDGKAIMQFRNYKKDITERLNEILTN